MSTPSSNRRISPVLLGFFIAFVTGFISVKILQPWLGTVERGSPLWRFGWIFVDFIRLIGLVGYGLILYGIGRGVARLFRRQSAK